MGDPRRGAASQGSTPPGERGTGDNYVVVEAIEDWPILVEVRSLLRNAHRNHARGNNERARMLLVNAQRWLEPLMTPAVRRAVFAQLDSFTVAQLETLAAGAVSAIRRLLFHVGHERYARTRWDHEYAAFNRARSALLLLNGEAGVFELPQVQQMIATNSAGLGVQLAVYALPFAAAAAVEAAPGAVVWGLMHPVEAGTLAEIGLGFAIAMAEQGEFDASVFADPIALGEIVLVVIATRGQPGAHVRARGRASGSGVTFTAIETPQATTARRSALRRRGSRRRVTGRRRRRRERRRQRRRRQRERREQEQVRGTGSGARGTGAASDTATAAGPPPESRASVRDTRARLRSMLSQLVRVLARNADAETTTAGRLQAQGSARMLFELIGRLSRLRLTAAQTWTLLEIPVRDWHNIAIFAWNRRRGTRRGGRSRGSALNAIQGYILERILHRRVWTGARTRAATIAAELGLTGRVRFSARVRTDTDHPRFRTGEVFDGIFYIEHEGRFYPLVALESKSRTNVGAALDSFTSPGQLQRAFERLGRRVVYFDRPPTPSGQGNLRRRSTATDEGAVGDVVVDRNRLVIILGAPTDAQIPAAGVARTRARFPNLEIERVPISAAAVRQVATQLARGLPSRRLRLTQAELESLPVMDTSGRRQRPAVAGQAPREALAPETAERTGQSESPAASEARGATRPTEGQEAAVQGRVPRVRVAPTREDAPEAAPPRADQTAELEALEAELESGSAGPRRRVAN